MADRKHSESPTTLTAEEARQGRIVLNTPRRRIIFFAGIIGFVLLSIAAALLWH